MNKRSIAALHSLFLMLLLGICNKPEAKDLAFALTSAKSVSRFTAIKFYCPQQIPTDVALADKFSEVFTHLGRQNASPSEWYKMMTQEGVRRLKEVQATGDRQWCDNQRRFLEESGEFRVLRPPAD